MIRGARFIRWSLVVTIAAISACGHAKNDEPARDTTIRIPPEWSEYRPGLDRPPLMAVHAQLGVDLQTLENAASIVAIECMRRAGFDYRPTITEPIRSDPLALGDLDPKVTARMGYEIPVGFEGGMTEAEIAALPESRYTASLSRADAEKYQRALWGREAADVEHPEPGCLDRARRSVAGRAAKDWQSLADDVSEQWAQVDRDVRASDGWKAAEGRWSRCMKRRGFDYASSDDAGDDAYERFDVEHRKTASKAERALATADARCRRQVDYIRLTIELSEPFERKALTRIEPQVLAWMAERDRVLAHVEAEVAKAGG